MRELGFIQYIDGLGLVGREYVPLTSKDGTCSTGQFVNGAQLSSPLAIAVAWTRMMCSSLGVVGTGVGVAK